ncbi:MAG TPA: hypothetical protein PJ994_08010 [Tepidiformaceae bacterium]|nr:hypothetical protein [Tepidiformaceae bacterium]
MTTKERLRELVESLDEDAAERVLLFAETDRDPPGLLRKTSGLQYFVDSRSWKRANTSRQMTCSRSTTSIEVSGRLVE